ncbi:MAG: T9SS type A sorting domain-containing protein [Bacteroidia bacterium]
MKSKKLFIAILFLAALSFTRLYAQESPVASGGDATGSGGSASYSVGQIVYTTNGGSSGTVAQGVQQPYEISTITGIPTSASINLYASAFPNPVLDFVTLKISDRGSLHLSYQLYAVDGKLVKSGLITADETPVVMSGLVPATYILKVLSAGSELKTFKIIKN